MRKPYTAKPVFRGHLNIPVSLHALTWARWDTVLGKCSLIKGVLSSECPLKTGFTVCYPKDMDKLHSVTSDQGDLYVQAKLPPFILH